MLQNLAENCGGSFTKLDIGIDMTNKWLHGHAIQIRSNMDTLNIHYRKIYGQ